MFKKILVANRAEVAIRVMRACREMGIRTVAVYSEADRDCLHRRYADEDLCIGPAPSESSYLNIPSIISAAEVTDADAIHPGYGFLAENAHFAEVCESCKVAFIGPRPQAIEALGNKVSARKKVKALGLPVVPGSDDVVKDSGEALRVASEIGYPLIIKAQSGGGGRGMKVAHNDNRLVSAFSIAQAEAGLSSGDNSLYLEKYIEGARHIEFQIMADNYGRIIHLGERDCSIQRRYQKLVEESPSPGLDPKLRKQMARAALKIASAYEYNNIGTVEFLLDPEENFYFLEVNTRVQVEHPVTEARCGIDIIKEQIRLASGEKLRFSQRDIVMKGAAIECRIYAEDISRNFMPEPGKIVNLYLPGGFGIRVDSHVYQDYIMPPYYDSLVAKLIAYGNDRSEAIARMKRALEELVIDGIKTTAPFCLELLSDPNFKRGRLPRDLFKTFALPSTS